MVPGGSEMLCGALEDEYEKILVMICVRGAGGFLDWEVKLSLQKIVKIVCPMLVIHLCNLK